ncbi:hypothetical protein Y032_0481g2270 [Ancylostoma ceylanicum]|uniref:CHCH domain-containing protein n=1 Tax=Ancylostoma ceylanicum TaxID=53326 RepID=A0A016WW13_9BILA|nr:hypothetical protein Y032_0481g2270 [Ancylostoma ceylanicum]
MEARPIRKGFPENAWLLLPRKGLTSESSETICGHFFRRLYVCMSEDDNQDATVKCPEQFIDWAACMQNMSDERRMQMRTHLLEPDQKEIS